MLHFIEWLRASRVGQLLEPLLFRFDTDLAPAEQQNDDFFLAHRVAADDPRRGAVYDNFQANLAEICRVARRAGAGVVLMTVPSNLKDCPPLGSLHRAGLASAELARWQSLFESGAAAEAAGRYAEALTNYTQAAELDDHVADLHFRRGACAMNVGLADAARDGFLRARDWDALQFRADSRMNNDVRKVCEAAPKGSACLVDAERLLAESEPDRLPGGRLFYDHVHLTFDGNYALAKALLPVIGEQLAPRLGTTTNQSAPVLSREECARRLAFTRVNEGQALAQMLKTTALPPFTLQSGHAQRQRLAEQKAAAQFGDLGPADVAAAGEVYREAMKLAPQDWRLPFQLGQMRLLTGDAAGALESMRAARQLLPHWTALRIGIAAALRNAGRREEAMRELREAEALAPWSETVQSAIRSLQ